MLLSLLRQCVILLCLIFCCVNPCKAQEQTLVLRHVRQYTLPLQEGRSVVVIDGEVVNATPVPQSRIAVVATLYDRDGNILGSVRQLCGAVLDSRKIASMKYSEIVASLSAYRYAHTGPFVVAPQQAIPFLVVFPDDPVPYEFSVSAYVLDLGKE